MITACISHLCCGITRVDYQGKATPITLQEWVVEELYVGGIWAQGSLVQIGYTLLEIVIFVGFWVPLTARNRIVPRDLGILNRPIGNYSRIKHWYYHST